MSKRLTKYSKDYWIRKGFSDEEASKKILEFIELQKKNRKNCKEYWTSRGFSEDESIIKVKEFQSAQSKKRKNRLTPSQKEFWIKKGFSEEESKLKIKEIYKESSIFTLDYWRKQGIPDGEAKKIIWEIQSKNSRKRKNFNKDTFNVRKEFWIKKGFSEKESLEKLKKRQSTNSLEKFVEKYGELEGIKKWRERQIKWQKTLNSRYSKEIRKSWNSFTYSDYVKKYGKERADKWLKNKFFHNKKTYSNIQIRLFNEIKKEIDGKFYFGENEYVLKREKGVYILDFYDSYSKKAIEFYGDIWHANPLRFNKNDKPNPFLKEFSYQIWDRDEKRIKNIVSHDDVEDLLIIWEKDFIENPEEIIKKCINFLTNGKKIYKKY